MTLSFYNTLSRRIEPFEPLEPPLVKLYTCGPTVYDFAHIGNFRAYVVEDLLRRILAFRGYRVLQVMNITDIDDKIIRASSREGVSLADFTWRYREAFFEDIQRLNIEKAEHYPPATGHINEMVELIQGLVERGHAYRGDDGSYYFSIGTFKGYGKLARLNMDEMKTGVRVKLDEYDKEKASDFALWKAWDKEDGDVFWDTELGRGRPGWHIECSAMAMKYLGPRFDIHMGGVDNIFPHHENEIAQSEACTGETFVNYWVHCEHLLVDHRKMSKSMGNFYTLRDLVEKGFSPLALRYLYISTHYRSRLNFTIESLSAAQNTVNGLTDFIARLSKLPAGDSASPHVDNLVTRVSREFRERLFCDMDTPNALSALFNFITQVNRLIDNQELNGHDGTKIQELLFSFDRILGLNLGRALEETGLPADLQKLVEERERARKSKDYKRADELRDLLKERGILLKDTPTGAVWKKM